MYRQVTELLNVLKGIFEHLLDDKILCSLQGFLSLVCYICVVILANNKYVYLQHLLEFLKSNVAGIFSKLLT